MSEKMYKIIKTVPNTILIKLHPVSNQSLSKNIVLTDRIPQQVLPEDWALDVFLDSSLYEMYRKGYITFNDNEGILRAAIEAGVYFGDELDFTPAEPDQESKILEVLKSGNRTNTTKAIEEYGREAVLSVAQAHISDLTHGVISMLEGILKVQFTADGE